MEETGESLGENDERTVADLLIEQVEFCDVLLISKTDLISPERVAELTAVLRKLNSRAEIIPMSKGNVPLAKVLNTGRFDFLQAQLAPGWLKEMRGEHTPETEEYGISSFVYRARKPFHPQKIYDFFSNSQTVAKNLLRSKGYFWLASRPHYAGQWSQAGGIAQHGAAGLFWHAVPKEHWPDDAETVQYILEKWQEPFGDRRQELVFIGRNLDQAAFIADLDACLLTDEEIAQGETYWQTLPDPFPSWSEKH